MAPELRKIWDGGIRSGAAESAGADDSSRRPEPSAGRPERDDAVSSHVNLLGSSAGLRRNFEQIEVVAPTDVPVVILGETGVGKELVAQAIHERSSRSCRPLVKTNCTAIPRDLFECEFFGHVRGAFTGAVKSRIGRFQLADHGTLFLDEVGDLPPEMQPKLLRVLQDGEFEAVGDVRTRRVDVRIIAASNRNLESLVRAGRFREDLYYRLSVFPIEVPPLREREGDIAILARYFLARACERFGRQDLQLSEDQIEQMSGYPWPGNIRELQNLVERAVISARSGSLRLDVPGGMKSCLFGNPPTAPAACPNSRVVPEQELKRRGRENIVAALTRSHGKIYGPGGAAEMLGIKPTTLCSRMKKMRIRRGSARPDSHSE